MGIAKARRIAERVHRGHLFADGLLLAHLERVAQLVEELTSSPIVVQAAWLSATPAAGLGSQDLLRRGVPARVTRIVDLLPQRPGDYPSAVVDRVLRDRRAALVQYAVLTDWHRHLAGQHRYEYWRDQHARLADALGLLRPAAASQASPAGVDRLPTLIAAHRELDGGEAGCHRWNAIRSAIYRIATAPQNASREPVVELIEQFGLGGRRRSDLSRSVGLPPRPASTSGC